MKHNIAAKNLALPQYKNKIIPNKKRDVKNGKSRFIPKKELNNE